MQHYEILFITPATAETDAQAPATAAVFELLGKMGASITKQDEWGTRSLSYEINHKKQGAYHLAEFDLDPLELKKVTKELRLMPEVIRYIITKKKVKTEEELAEEQRIREKIQERKVREAHVAAVEEQEKEKKEEKEKVAKAAKEEPAAEPKGEKIRLEELDKKLDDILTEDV